MKIWKASLLLSSANNKGVNRLAFRHFYPMLLIDLNIGQNQLRSGSSNEKKCEQLKLGWNWYNSLLSSPSSQSNHIYLFFFMIGTISVNILQHPVNTISLSFFTKDLAATFKYSFSIYTLRDSLYNELSYTNSSQPFFTPYQMSLCLMYQVTVY